MSDRIEVSADGALSLPPLTLPPSPAWSERARQVFMNRFRRAPLSAAAGRATPHDEEWLAWARDFRAGMAAMHRRMDEINRSLYPVRVEPGEMDGVPVQVVTPAEGSAPLRPHRTLINLHGGAFVGGSEFCGLVESAPLASVSGFRVVVADYRQGWEHRFPAASEDVASVYRSLLRDHAPTEIGIFGYSAGGILTAQSMAWFQQHGLPNPGAIAICSAGAGVALEASGDSGVLAVAAMGDLPSGTPAVRTTHGYFAGADPSDPLVSPLQSPDMLARFPPSLILTGSRSFDLSASLLAHRALLEAGAECELHCWEAMWHCFPYNADMPEARDALRTLSAFFSRRLSGR